MIAVLHGRPFRRAIAAAVLALIGLGAAYLGLLRLSGNFNTVVVGEFYRSGQVTPRRLEDYVAKYGIRTVVNLRGDNTGRSWYDDEVAESRKLHVDHIDFGISARHELTEKQAAELMSILRSAQKPILVHCEAGADRSGLVSALYLAIVKNWNPEVAENQLSIRFGHISLPFIAEYAMNRSFEKLEPLLSGSSVK